MKKLIECPQCGEYSKVRLAMPWYIKVLEWKAKQGSTVRYQYNCGHINEVLASTLLKKYRGEE